MSSLKRKLISLAAAAALSLAAGLPGALAGPASCAAGGRQVPSGTVVKVDAQGNAWTASSDVQGPVQVLSCTAGTWTVTAAASVR
ncbi:MAG TPA: hypothetical protein VLW53_12955 [Candidatus Eisenbacteria bacterium]|nr:hypothetical protein [Candidatus Eisenbacteria bacterium]